MKQNWTYKKLGDCFPYIKNGANIKQEKNAKGYPITRIETLSGGVFNRDRLGYANIFELEKYLDYILSSHDLLMSHINSKAYVGRTVEYIADEQETIIHGMNLLRLKNNPETINSSFFAYYTHSCNFKSEIAKIRKDAVNQSSFTISDLKKISIPVPPLSTQSRIVSELDLLQSLIDKQKAQLKELDTLAQSIFYDMFGDPVANEKGWAFASIKDVCDSIVRGPFGSALKKEFFVEPNDSTYKVYEQKHAIQKDATIGSYYIDNERFQSLKRFELKVGDIIMSCSGTIGELFEIPLGAEKGIMNQALLKFTLNRSIDKWYFLFAMDFIKESFETKGTGLQNIGSVITIKNTKVSLPPLTLQDEFAEKIENIERQKSAISQSIAETRKLFDYTMDKYFG